MTPDLRLYGLLDPAVAGGRSLVELAKLIAGQATIVQRARKPADQKSVGCGPEIRSMP